MPTYMLATTPQNTSGRWVMRSGPGWMPVMISAPSRIAVAGEKGIPSDSSGTMAPAVAPLLAASGPATPSMAPCPKRSGVFETLRSSVYEMKVASTLVGPGISPVKNPTREPRAIGAADCRHSSRVGSSSCSRTVTMYALFRAGLGDDSNTSATPYNPMITGTSSMPWESWTEPNVKRRMAEIGSMPTVPRARPIATSTNACITEPPESRESSSSPATRHREVFGRTEAEGLVGEPGRGQDDTDHAEGAGDE